MDQQSVSTAKSTNNLPYILIEHWGLSFGALAVFREVELGPFYFCISVFTNETFYKGSLNVFI